MVRRERDGTGDAPGAASTQVSVTINGRQFRMACEEGQEERVLELARELDARIDGLRSKFGEIGDTRLTVMAALTIVDEFSEMSARIKRLEAELAVLQDTHATATDRHRTTRATVAAALTSAAERIERVAKRLNANIGTAGLPLG